MKKHIALGILGVSLFGIAGAAQAAPDRVGHLELGGQAGIALDSRIDDGAYAQINLDWGVTPYVALGVEGGWYEASGSSPDETVGVVHILGDIIVRSPDFHDSIVPYGILGLGVVGAYVEDTDGNAPNNNGADSYGSSFAWKLGAGIEWLFHPNWALNLELAYFGTSVDLPNTTVGDDGIDHWKLGGGIKYIF